MRIESFSFSDRTLEWTLDPTSFSKLTLLVGASGVGKTHILGAISTLKQVALGKPSDGIKWKVTFKSIQGRTYTWEGEYESMGLRFMFEDTRDGISRSKPKIRSERITMDGKLLAIRNTKTIKLEERLMPKLAHEQSIVHLLKEEKLIAPLYESFRQIRHSDHSRSSDGPFSINFFSGGRLRSTLKTIDDIRDANESVRLKLYLCYCNVKAVFKQIESRYKDIFPQIEAVKFEPMDIAPHEEVPEVIKEMPVIQIKERGVSKWIDEHRMSSGMLRTLIHLSELHLSKEGTVFLIDEFENSLGINCIDELTSDIVSDNRKLQFIISSHHPYIINNVKPGNWKLVTRTSGVVRAEDAAPLIEPNSRHAAFMQLVQLRQFKTGRHS